MAAPESPGSGPWSSPSPPSRRPAPSGCRPAHPCMSPSAGWWPGCPAAVIIA